MFLRLLALMFAIHHKTLKSHFQHSDFIFHDWQSDGDKA